MKAILDTNVLIDATLGDYPTVSEYAITSISYAELRYGVARAKNQHERVARSYRIRTIEEAFGAGLPFDDRAAFSYGLVTELLAARNRTPRGRVADLMIAAIAHANNSALITHNVGDFQGLETVLNVITA